MAEGKAHGKEGGALDVCRPRETGTFHSCLAPRITAPTPGRANSHAHARYCNSGNLHFGFHKGKRAFLGLRAQERCQKQDLQGVAWDLCKHLLAEEALDSPCRCQSRWPELLRACLRGIGEVGPSQGPAWVQRMEAAALRE